jgi:ABC-type antimicrobial peptide transport system permease subunit
MALNSRWRKILRDVQKRKTQTLLVSASIFIGVLGVVTLFSMSEILVTTLEAAVQQDKLAMIRIYVRLKGNESAATDLSALDKLPKIEHVQGLSHHPVYWKRPGDTAFSEGALFGYSYPLPDVQIEPVELVSGRWPQAGQPEIVVERRFASKYGVKIGDTLVFRILSESSGTIPEENYTVVGTVFEPYQYPILPGAPTQISAYNMIFADLPVVERISGFVGYNMIQARYADFATAQAQSGAFEKALADDTPYVSSITLTEDPAKNSLIEQTRIFSNVLSLLAIVSLVVSGFLVLNVVNANVLEQRRQIGVMKSLGATGLDNFVMYAGISLVYGVIGVIPGVLIGIPLGFAGAENVAPLFNIFLDKFRYSTTAIIIGTALGLLIPVGSAALPVLMGIRVTILEAITDLGINATYGQGPITRLLEVVPLPFDLRQSLRNVSQKKGRLALTMIALALAAGAFMGVYATLSSFNTIVAKTIGQVGINISVNPRGTYDFEAVRKLILDNVGGIKAIEPGTVLAIDIEGFKPQQIGPGPAFLIASGINPTNPDIAHFDLRSGTAWRGDPMRQGVVISASIADQMHVTTGDTLTIHVGGSVATLPIIGVANYTFDTVWMRWDELSRLGGLITGAPVPNQYLATVDLNGTTVAALGVDAQVAPLLTFTAGGFITPGQPGVIITTALADSGGYAVGDTLTLKAGTNQLVAPVTGIFTLPPQLIQPGQSQEGIALYWKDLATLEGVPLDGSPQPASLQIVLDQKKPSLNAVDAKIQTINDLLLAHGINASYTNWVESTDGITQQLRTASVVLNTAAALIAAVGMIGLLSSLSMSVFERQKEIGVMRSVGATSYTIAFLFLVEGLIVGLIAWVIGIPFSYALNRTLVYQFHFENAIGSNYPPPTLLLGLGGMLVIAIVASLWPSIAAARKTVSDILRYQ